MKVREKLNSFSKAAAFAAAEKIKSIEAEMNARYARECEQIHNEAAKEANEKIKEEKLKLENMQNKDISESSRNAKSSVVEMRRQQIAELCKNVASQLESYAETEDYFIKLAADMRAVYDEYGAVTFYLCPRDMLLKDKLLAGMENVRAVQADTDIIGGFKARAEKGNLQIDYSFLAKLEEERENFNEIKIL